MVTQSDIARHAGLDLSTVNRILNNRGLETFREETVRKVFDVARRLEFDFDRLRYFHRRRGNRARASIVCECSVLRDDGTLYDQGRCRLLEISNSGAFISDVFLGRESIPTGPVEILLRPQEGKLQGLEIRGRIVRYPWESPGGYGVIFENPGRTLVRRLNSYISVIGRAHSRARISRQSTLPAKR